MTSLMAVYVKPVALRSAELADSADPLIVNMAQAMRAAGRLHMLEWASRLPALEKLTLMHSQLDAGDTALMCSVTKLKELELCHVMLDHDSVRALSHLTALESLVLDAVVCSAITPGKRVRPLDCAVLRPLTQLQHLSMRFTPQAPNSLHHALALPQLQVLSVTNSKGFMRPRRALLPPPAQPAPPADIADQPGQNDNMVNMGQLGQLLQGAVFDVPASNQQADDTGAPEANELVGLHGGQLRALDLQHFHIVQSAHFEFLPTLTQLTELRLGRLPPQQGFTPLLQLPALRTLLVRSVWLEAGSTLAQVSTLTGLEHLEMHYGSISRGFTPAWLHHLAPLQALTALVIYACNDGLPAQMPHHHAMHDNGLQGDFSVAAWEPAAAAALACAPLRRVMLTMPGLITNTDTLAALCRASTIQELVLETVQDSVSLAPLGNLALLKTMCVSTGTGNTIGLPQAKLAKEPQELAPLAALPELKDVQLQTLDRVSRSHARVVRGVANLRGLSLASSSPVASNVLEHLTASPHLHELVCV